MTATTTRTTAPPVPLDETEAAELEALAPMPDDLLPLRNRKLKIDEQMEKLEFELKKIKDEFDDRLKADGLDGYTINGKVRGRRSSFKRFTINSKLLKEKHPRIYKAFLTETPVVSIKIT